MLRGFTLRKDNLLECDFCKTTFNDEAEAKKHHCPDPYYEKHSYSKLVKNEYDWDEWYDMFDEEITKFREKMVFRTNKDFILSILSYFNEEFFYECAEFEDDLEKWIKAGEKYAKESYGEENRKEYLDYINSDALHWDTDEEKAEKERKQQEEETEEKRLAKIRKLTE